MLCSIDPNEALELDFTLQVFGTSASSIEPRFIIIGPDFAIACFCTPQEDSVKVKIPKLQGIIPPGRYPVKFEVILGEQIFNPIEDEIEIKAPVKIEVSKPTVLKQASIAPKVEVKLTPKVESTPQPAVIEQAPITVSTPAPAPSKRASFESLKNSTEEERKTKLPLFKDLTS